MTGHNLNSRGVLAALVLALAWTYILLGVFDVLGGWILEAEIHGIQAMGISDRAEIHSVRAIIDPLVYSLIFGLLGGVPFGLIVRQNIFRYWLLFVTAVLAIGLVQNLLSDWGIAMFFAGWYIPDPWLYLAGVLVVAIIVACARNRYDKTPANDGQA